MLSFEIACVYGIKAIRLFAIPVKFRPMKIPRNSFRVLRFFRGQTSPSCAIFVAMRTILFLLLFSIPAHAIEPIPRKLPPAGGGKVNAEAKAKIESRLSEVEKRLREASLDNPADIAIFTKAVRFALDHDEFYKVDHDKIALKLLDEAEKRLSGKWEPQKGVFVRGYTSAIDGSAQPYGLEIPESLDLSKPVPLWVWLHGRGDTTTDMHFISQRMGKRGQFQPDNAIVLHPFGRQCIGWKSAGEIDIFEAIAHVSQNYKIDPDRIALMGFSMGGAGAWHVGAHYTDRFACVHAGAGFAETKEYINLKKEDYPPAYEQTLWGVYDVPNYVRNLFNAPVLAYSGEDDKQIQAARVMERAFKAEGQTLSHIIGPKMGHKYHKDSLKEVADFVQNSVTAGRDRFAEKVTLQTQTLRYHRMHWIEATGLEQHWQDSRIDAEKVKGNGLRIATKNITALTITRPWEKVPGKVFIIIDGDKLESGKLPVHLIQEDGHWQIGEFKDLRKRPGLQGPIDDAFLAPFLVVLPSGKSKDAKVQEWIDFELTHFKERWRALFRGDLRTKLDTEVTADDIIDYNLIIWGDPDSNKLIAPLLNTTPYLKWPEKEAQILSAIYPNLFQNRYIVLNSGPTFREDHDRTNSLQNPKLPDWAIIDISTPPNGTSPGKVLDAGFFDEAWQLKQ